MPYIIISVQIRTEHGPTFCGDKDSDVNLMCYLDAVKFQDVGQNFIEYRSPHPPRIIMDKLETVGYKVVSCAGCGQTVIWTLHKD
uniref:GTP cyclohydrolase 1 feedback regulatory protein n=1 Tax=Hydra vulgaris TaxID=6087 RepID=T2MGS8_HYDVU